MWRPSSCRGLHKSYGGHVALRGVDLRVEQGEILGFLGPNGSGKTTAMRIALGFLRADSGEVRVLGVDPWTERAHRRRVGYLPSSPRFYERMRGGSLLAHLETVGGAPAVLRDDLCERLALSTADLARPVHAYSRGMRQKLGIVQALQHDPELCVPDEPSEGSIRLSRRRSSRPSGIGAAPVGRSSSRRTCSARSTPSANARTLLTSVVPGLVPRSASIAAAASS